VRTSEQLNKVVDTQARLSNDGSERAGLQVSSCMYRHRDGSRLIARISHDTMTADNSIEVNPALVSA
jgi:hypothetical protein